MKRSIQCLAVLAGISILSMGNAKSTDPLRDQCVETLSEFEVPQTLKINIEKKVVKREQMQKFGGLRDLDEVDLQIHGKSTKPQVSYINQFVTNVSQWIKQYLRGSVDYTSNLANYGDRLYSGDVYIGSDKQKFNVVFDTGSDYLIIEEKGCSNCVSKMFDTATSSSFAVNATDTTNALSYGSASVTGYIAIDTVSFDSAGTFSKPGFNFFLIQQQTGISSYFDGILGMSRPNGTALSRHISEMMVQNLKFDGKISSRVFSFFLGNSNEQSTFELGGYTEANMRNPAELTYITLSPHYFWLINVDAFRIGTSDRLADKSLAAFRLIKMTRAIVDSGTSLIYVPNSAFVVFVNTLMANISFEYQSGMIFGPCDKSLYKSVFLNIQGNYFEITPEQFIIDVGISGYCMVAFSQNSADYWLLGDAFLRAYYSIWDDENNRIGLAPHKTSTATITVAATLPDFAIFPPENQIYLDLETYSWNLLEMAGLQTGFAGAMSLFAFSFASLFTGFNFIVPMFNELLKFLGISAVSKDQSTSFVPADLEW